MSPKRNRYALSIEGEGGDAFAQVEAGTAEEALASAECHNSLCEQWDMDGDEHAEALVLAHNVDDRSDMGAYTFLLSVDGARGVVINNPVRG